MEELIRRGDVVWCRFDPTVGCEIRKLRPAVVVSADDRNGNFNNPLLIVVPLTKTPILRQPRRDEVVIQPGSSGLSESSITAVDQVRAVDRQRIHRRVGCIGGSVMAAIDRCLQRVLALA